MLFFRTYRYRSFKFKKRYNIFKLLIIYYRPVVVANEASIFNVLCCYKIAGTSVIQFNWRFSGLMQSANANL